MKMMKAGVDNLVLGIMKRAIDDYEEAVLKQDYYKIAALERFFQSDWCDELTNGVDGKEIIRSLKVQIKYKEWRKQHKCGSCKKNCIHRSGQHYTTFERGNLFCLRLEE